MITFAYSVEAPLWTWMIPIVVALGIVVRDRHRARADAQALVEWQDGLWRRWQTHVHEHATHYDRYWGEVCSALVRVYVERAGDARLHEMVRGAQAQGTSAVTIAHGLASAYADDADFIRTFRAFSSRPPRKRSRTHGR
jgi:hypothetical protein